VADGLGNKVDTLSSLITASSASGGVRRSGDTDRDGWFLMAAATLDSSTSGELRGVLGFSERRRDGSDVPRSGLDDGFFSR